MKAIFLSLVLASSLASAQPAPTQFPEGAAAVTPDALKDAVAGKVFAVKASRGPMWRWQFDANGVFFINIGSFSDSGKWSTKDSALCTEGRQIKASCNEVQTKDQELYLKRDNGEVVKLDAR